MLSSSWEKKKYLISESYNPSPLVAPLSKMHVHKYYFILLFFTIPQK